MAKVMETVTRVRIFDETFSTSYSANKFGKGMDLTILPPAMDMQLGRPVSSIFYDNLEERNLCIETMN